MPNDVKAVVSVITLLVAAAIAYWEFGNGRVDLSWVVIGIGIFMIISMWLFPETDGKKTEAQKLIFLSPGGTRPPLVPVLSFSFMPLRCKTFWVRAFPGPYSAAVVKSSSCWSAKIEVYPPDQSGGCRQGRGS